MIFLLISCICRVRFSKLQAASDKTMTLRFLSFLLGGLLFMSCIIAGMAQGQERDSSVSAAEVPSASGSTFTFSPKFFRVLDASQLEKLKTAPSVGAVYFYKQVLHVIMCIYKYICLSVVSHSLVTILMICMTGISCTYDIILLRFTIDSCPSRTWSNIGCVYFSVSILKRMIFYEHTHTHKTRQDGYFLRGIF